MLGSHVAKTWSHTQKTVALSSGEAELTAMVKCTCEGLGLLSLLKDWGLEMSLTVLADSSAALGVARRRGAGKIRHVKIGLLWIQDMRDEKMVEFMKVDGVNNPADLMTKLNSTKLLEDHCRRLGLRAEQGRASQASEVSRGIPNYQYFPVQYLRQPEIFRSTCK